MKIFILAVYGTTRYKARVCNTPPYTPGNTSVTTPPEDISPPLPVTPVPPSTPTNVNVPVAVTTPVSVSLPAITPIETPTLLVPEANGNATPLAEPVTSTMQKVVANNQQQSGQTCKY